jgi:hypothetical protein
MFIADDTYWTGWRLPAVSTTRTPIVITTASENPDATKAIQASFASIWDNSKPPTPFDA